ncbi:VOC family protein [Dehalococcoidia bacterium]|nr:VOC family protein [Dehalococcoidia bacterium]
MFTRIHHLGLVVSDLQLAKKLWVDTYGFQVDESRSPLPDGRYVSLDNVTILDIPVGESELEINKANDLQSGTGRYLKKHGAGIHHLCLYSDDIDRDVERLHQGGLEIAVPPTGEKGQQSGSRVAFFHPRGNLGFLLEIWEDMFGRGVSTELPLGRGGGFTYLHHVGMVCSSMEEAKHLFGDIYGLAVDEVSTPLPDGRYSESDNVRIIEFMIGKSNIEVMVPQDEASGTARFLASRGSGIHHICLYSEDFEYDVTRLKAAGLQQLHQLSTPGREGNRITFFHPRSNMGVLVEIWHDSHLF